MSGPQGTDPTQPWQPPQGEGQHSGEDHTQQASPWQQQAGGEHGWQPSGGDQQTWHAPAYTPTEYGQYQQPATAVLPAVAPYPQRVPAAGPIRRPDQPLTASRVSTASQVSLAQYPQQPGQYGQYGPVPAVASPGSTASTRASYGQPPAGPKRSERSIGTHHRCVGRRPRRGGPGAGLLAPGFFVTTKLDVGKARPACSRSSPTDQRLRREERQRRQMQRRSEPDREKG